MPRALITENEIHAAPSLVWRVVTDFPMFPEWNPFIREAHGDLRVGGKLRLSFTTPAGIGMKATATLVQVEPDYELRWIGSLLVPLLMDIEHFFIVEPLAPNKTRFVHGETFGGMLVPVFIRMLQSEVMGAYRAMNQALKQRAEILAAGGQPEPSLP
jgi:hypothetical protein